MTDPVQDEIKEIVHKYGTTLQELLKEFTEKHDLKNSAVYQVDKGWQVVAQDPGEKPYNILWLHPQIGKYPLIHLHIMPELEHFGGKVFGDLASLIHTETGLQVVVYPPPFTVLDQRIQIIDEGYEEESF